MSPIESITSRRRAAESRSPRILAILCVAALGWSCGGGGGNGGGSPASATPAPTLNDFVGSWKASSVKYTNQADPTQTFDLVAAGGEVRFTMLTGGGTRTWVELGTFSDEWDAQVSVSGATVTSVPVESTRPTVVSTYTMVGGLLTLTDMSATFDFSLSGAPGVAATQVSVFARD